MILFAFKFALDADMNQGCISSIFCSFTGVFVAIVFYCSFKETISKAKIVGMAFISLCVVFLTFDKKVDADDEVGGYSAQEKRVYGGLAVLCGIAAPIIWTYKQYYLRKTIIDEKFSSTIDLAMDTKLVYAIVLTVIFLCYIATHESVDIQIFVEGQIVAVIDLIGCVTSTMCFDTGPGGPIVALVSTAIVY